MQGQFETTDRILKMCNNNGIINYILGDEKPWLGRCVSEDDFECEGWEADYVALECVVKPAKIYSNGSCPCGSGKKYKKFCGRKAETR